MIIAGVDARAHAFADQALLLEFADSTARDVAARAMRAADPTVELVLGEVTILLPTSNRRPRIADLTHFAGEVAEPARAELEHSQARQVNIPVRFDGPDLAEVAEATDLSVQALVAEITDATFHAAFGGFAPGFTYLTGLPERLHLARRASPRDIVPAGSVAIADRFAGIYPRPSPGGWHLLGSTDVVLFDPEREPPTLLVPGDLVRFTDDARRQP